jgi:hypothetical protein
MQTQPTGLIVYEGPSRLDGQPIVAILTLHSDNRKTGDMCQLWIIRSDMSPVAAIKAGADESICGDCIHRGDGTGKKRSCYVNAGQAPNSVFITYINGGYPVATAQSLRDATANRMVRLGAYGDPASLPIQTIRSVTKHADGWTGYSHQWRIRPSLRPYVMASVDTPQEAAQARAKGWRYFRVSRLADRAQGEAICPSDKGIQCIDCNHCNGHASGRRGSVVIQVHGSGAVHFN